MSNNQKNTDWYKLSETDILDKLNTKISGLTEEEATIRLNRFGKNALPTKKSKSILHILFDQIKNPLIYILIAAGLVSYVIGEYNDSIIIFGVILINTVIGSYQEWKAEKSSEALKNLLKIFVTVKRNNERKLLDAVYLVPGDIVLLESGSKAPADLRLLKETNLMTDESLLTGESTPVKKIVDTIEQDVLLSDRENMLFAGSMITSGRGIGVVTETGLNTEIGRIAKAVTLFEDTKPPLIRRMEVFSSQVSIIILFLCSIIAVVQIYRGESLVDVFFIAVALAVSSIPEGLPAALTVALSVGMSRMSKRNVIIRKLPAVEGLGSCTLIASDKTGTLTVNKQTVKIIISPDGSIFFVSGEGYNGIGKIIPNNENIKLSNIDELIKCSVICNEASLISKNGEWISHGDAVDIALLAIGYKYGYNSEDLRENIKILREIPFESERKYSAKFYTDNSDVKVVIKGALEVILAFCTKMKVKNTVIKLDEESIENHMESLSGEGYRTIALAEGIIKRKHDHDYYEEDISDLIFLGLVGLIDPLRPEAQHAVNTCKEAGIKVIMITGDHPQTALTIGKELNIVKNRNEVVEGKILSEIDVQSDNYLKLINNSSVFARVTPMQKLHIIEALRASGEFIAVTGDGVNDAPALKKAHISVAMGSGTDIAKDVSSMIVVDDDFASVVAGVEEGRYSYDNIRKAIYLLVSTGASEIILFLLAIAFNTPLPLVAVQLLWLNLVTNGIQGVALAFEKGESESMQRPPRNPNEGIFNRLMIEEILISGFAIGIMAFALWYVLISNNIEEYTSRNIILLLMVLFENVHVFNCRSEYKSTFKIPIRNNLVLIIGVLFAQGIHIISMHISIMQVVLDIEPVGIKIWLYMFFFAVILLVLMEIYKIFKFRKN